MSVFRSSGALLAGALALAGGGLLLLRRATGGAGGSRPLLGGGCPAGSPSNLPPKASSDAAAARAKVVAERLRRLWPAATGDSGPPCEATLQILLSHAWLESGIAEAGGGGWWTDKTATGGGDMRGSGNLGARQCSGSGQSGAYFRCVEYGDSRPNKDGTQTKYPAKFRYYIDGVTPDGVHRSAADAAAWDFLHDVAIVWGALAELRSGDVRAYVKKLREKGYYQGFGATVQEREDGYGRAVAAHLPAVASSLGDPKVLPIVAPEFWGGKAYIAPSQVAGVDIDEEARAIASHLPAVTLALGGVRVQAVVAASLYPVSRIAGVNDDAGADLAALWVAGALLRARRDHNAITAGRLAWCAVAEFP